MHVFQTQLNQDWSFKAHLEGEWIWPKRGKIRRGRQRKKEEESFTFREAAAHQLELETHKKLELSWILWHSSHQSAGSESLITQKKAETRTILWFKCPCSSLGSSRPHLLQSFYWTPNCVYSTNLEVLLHLGGSAGHYSQDVIMASSIGSSDMLDIKSGHLSLQNPKSELVKAATAQGMREGWNRAEKYSGSSHSRESWQPIWLLCLSTEEWFSDLLKEPIQGLSSPCWRHRV